MKTAIADLYDLANTIAAPPARALRAALGGARAHQRVHPGTWADAAGGRVRPPC